MTKLKHFDEDSFATNPGNITLCPKKLNAFKREVLLRDTFLWLLAPLLKPTSRFEEQLSYAATEPAVVIETAPRLLVAAYSGDIDAVAILRFPKKLAQQYQLKQGTKLITINSYFGEFDLGPKQVGQSFGKDLIAGPHYEAWAGFYPMIADFLSNDVDQIESHKRHIPKSTWERITKLASEYRQKHPRRMRRGNPYLSDVEAKNFSLFPAW